MARVAEEVLADNGSRNIFLLKKESSEIVLGEDLPRKVDVIVSEILDSELIGEGVIPSIRHAVKVSCVVV